MHANTRWLWCGLVSWFAMEMPIASARELDVWDSQSGVWQVEDDSGRGKSLAAEWGEMVSTAWYGDLEFSGSIVVPTAERRGQQAAMLVRYAGFSECYKLVLDWSNWRVRLIENHNGKSAELAVVEVDRMAVGAAVRFHVRVREQRLTLKIGERAIVTQADLRIPGGRVGLAVRSGEMQFSKLAVTGSPSPDYVFHYNYALPPTLRKQPLWHFLNECGNELRTRYPAFRTRDQFESYRQRLLAGIRRSLGLDPWPSKSPLKARLVGKLDRGSYFIEKVLFESQPGFKVDALLYVPKYVEFPAPAVLSPAGHWWDDVFYPDVEQGRHIGLVKNGYVVLVYDPVGQGERAWLGPHNQLRKQIGLAGMDASGLMFWDSIRAIDYLCSRSEVDTSKIGVTGVSGGGFNTVHTALLDPRVKVCAPNGYATTIEALVKRATYGCCGHTPNLCLYGDHGELYACLAPKPTLILGGYTDVVADRVLPIYARSLAAYRLYGAEESLSYFLDPDVGHTYSFPERVRMIHFFNKHLRGIYDPDVAVKAQAENELLKRESGLLKVFPDGESKGVAVVELVKSFLQRNQKIASPPTTIAEAQELQQRIREDLISHMGDMAPPSPPRVLSDDGVLGYQAVRNIMLETEREIPVPLQVHWPAQGTPVRGLVIYLQMSARYPNGSRPKREMIQALLAEGLAVADPQVRGSGSTVPAAEPTFQLLSLAMGKHLFATRIFDLLRVVDFLQTDSNCQKLKITLWGEGIREGMMALYAAAIDSRVDSVVATHGLISYQNVIDQNGTPNFDWYVPGILRNADAVQIAAAVAPRKVIIEAPVDVRNSAADEQAIAAHYAWAAPVFRLLGGNAQYLYGVQVDAIAALLEIPTATVYGTLLAGGKPAAGARVEVLGSGVSTTTDVRGQYALTARVGTLTLRGSGRGYAPQLAQVTAVSGDRTRRDFDLRTVAREWSLSADFSQRANPNGAWTFGYQRMRGGVLTNYREFKWAGAYPDQFGFWKPRGGGSHDRFGSVDIYVGLDGSALYGLHCYDRNQVSLHAGGRTSQDDADKVYTTVRWTAPLDGKVRVHVRFKGIAYRGTGTHTVVGVTVNRIPKFTAQVDGFAGGGNVEPMGPSPVASYVEVLSVAVGDTIDFTCLANGEQLFERYVGCDVTLKEVGKRPKE